MFTDVKQNMVKMSILLELLTDLVTFDEERRAKMQETGHVYEIK